MAEFSRPLEAQGAVALRGTVSSKEEGKMEGVVVSARRDGATFTVSVVTDKTGRYGFPRSHLTAGSYTLTTRAVGYDLVPVQAVTVAAGKTATQDLSLEKTKDLPSQLSSLEWVNSFPGAPEMKDKFVYQLLSCAYCHTYERITKSKHSAEEFPATISRMNTYFNDGTALGRGNRGRAQKVQENPNFNPNTNPNWGSVPKTELGAFLATVNLSGGKTTWPYELKTLPRPTGKGTRVIITQYDLPKPDIVPHDLEVDSKGLIWVPDQSRQYIASFDPKTSAWKEYQLPALPSGRVGGVNDPHVDLQDRVWFPLTSPDGTSHFGRPTMLDPKTGKVTVVEGAPNNVQFTSRGPDGKMWFNDVNRIVSVDPKTMKMVDDFTILKNPAAPPGPHSMYQTGVASTGNVYALDWLGAYIITVDVKTGSMQWSPVPTKGSSPRRGKMDKQDRFWFSEYTGDKVGMFDTKTEKMQEWALPIKYTTPYAASAPDKRGYVYSTSNMSERILRLDPKTGEVVEYQVPTDFDSKEVLFDPTGTIVWMANTRNARLLKLELLD
jgi:streptogramin lyase